MATMSLSTRREYLIKIKPRYLKASKEEKTRMLDQFCQSSQMNRKYVIGLLQARIALQWKRDRKRKPRPPSYDNHVTYHLKKIWDILDAPCGQRLAPALPATIEALVRHKELTIPEEIVAKLSRISSATIDRLLKRWKATKRRSLHGTTKPGSLLKKQIPIQLSRWDERELGHSEIDLCAHNGGNPEGDFAHTLVDTDLASGWTEQEAILGKAQKRVKTALISIDHRRPFRRKSLDSDSGAEFINWLLFRFCEAEHVGFTRGRPGKKNDNPYVEQKNWTHVRKLVGYYRYDTDRQVDLVNDLYRNEWRSYENFFQPTIKLSGKERIGGHLKKTYEQARTPYERIMESTEVDAAVKEKLRAVYLTLNPAHLKRQIEKKLDVLFATVRRPDRASIPLTLQSGFQMIERIGHGQVLS